MSHKSATKPRIHIKINPLYRGGGEYRKSFFTAWERISGFYCEARIRLDETPISSTILDPDVARPVRPSLLVEYCADFEHIVERACKNDRKMQEAAISLLREQAGLGKADLGDNLKYRAIQRLGSSLTPRMEPGRYFVSQKRRRERRTNASINN